MLLLSFSMALSFFNCLILCYMLDVLVPPDTVQTGFVTWMYLLW